MRRSPTIRQVYAIAAALCTQADERWPETFDEASELIERLRLEIGHPHPRLEDARLPPPRPKWRRRYDRAIHDLIVAEIVDGDY